MELFTKEGRGVASLVLCFAVLGAPERVLVDHLWRLCPGRVAKSKNGSGQRGEDSTPPTRVRPRRPLRARPAACAMRHARA